MNLQLGLYAHMPEYIGQNNIPAFTYSQLNDEQRQLFGDETPGIHLAVSELGRAHLNDIFEDGGLVLRLFPRVQSQEPKEIHVRRATEVKIYTIPVTPPNPGAFLIGFG